MVNATAPVAPAPPVVSAPVVPADSDASTPPVAVDPVPDLDLRKYNVLTNLRFGLPHIEKNDEVLEMPNSKLHFAHRDEPGFENLPMFLMFNDLEESQAQRTRSMTEALAGMAGLGVFIRAAERCGGLSDFQAALQAVLSTFSALALAYADFLDYSA